ncbi:hypothetical protein [Nesterenkonia sp. F]|uniref:hypothetical protein n=1 Tax=Nesterenkonia sp. F TaxID=795955 RepID=UPI000255C891|nr:hypothetical protein [Nesterenkonia sp. F]
MSTPTTFDEYLSTLGRLTGHVDPTASTPEAEAIKEATHELENLNSIDVASLTTWIEGNPQGVPVLGLVVGLGREKLKNALKDRFNTSGWVTLARVQPRDLIIWLDTDYDLVRLLTVQQQRAYELGDVLVARAGTRVTATQAGKSGRRVEDDIEAIAADLRISYKARTRFVGRNGRTAPCDLVIPDGEGAEIVVAAKGFDSTGSKLTDAVREIEEMAEVRLPRQFVIAVIDGIGWKSRQSDLRKIHALWTSQQIDGMYTLTTLDQFRDDVEHAARLRGFL